MSMFKCQNKHLFWILEAQIPFPLKVRGFSVATAEYFVFKTFQLLATPNDTQLGK